MKILVSGSSGFIGKNLTEHLIKNGHSLTRLIRNENREDNTIVWDIKKKKYNLTEFENYDVVINLCGENIFGIWTKKKKQRLIDSRIESTRLLTEIFSKLDNPPKLFISASAIGFYGSRGEEILDEKSSKGNGFFAELADNWEKTANGAAKYGVRVVNFRIGLVFASDGGALEKMITPFKLGLGGKIADGEMYWSWITIEDLLSAVDFIINNNDISGPVNIVSPQPVKNALFTKILGSVLSRPTLVPLPKFIINNFMGEMGREIFLSSARVLPKKLLSEGFVFKDTDLEETLKSII